MWLIDAFNYNYVQKPSKREDKKAIKKKLDESDVSNLYTFNIFFRKDALVRPSVDIRLM